MKGAALVRLLRPLDSLVPSIFEHEFGQNLGDNEVTHLKSSNAKSPTAKHFFVLLICAGFLIMAVSGTSSVLAQTSGSALSPEAQKAYERGYAAAEQGEWELAIKYFSKAQKAAPESPEVFFNLAFACSNAGGRDILAIAWYRAYLAATPDAPNAQQVRNEIIKLEVKAEANVMELLRLAKDAAGEITDDDDKSEAYARIGKFQAETGNIVGAKATAALLADSYFRSIIYLRVAELQIKKGDIAGARESIALALKAVPEIEDDYYRDKHATYLAIAKLQAETGDIVGERKTLAQTKQVVNGIKSNYVYKSNAYREIAQVQVEAGNIAGASESIVLAKKAAAENTCDTRRSFLSIYAYMGIAELQIKKGDIAGARESIALAIKAVESSENYSNMIRDYMGIAELQIKAGDITSAREILVLALKEAESIIDVSLEYHKFTTYLAIAKLQAETGDIAGERKTLALAKKAAESMGDSYRSEYYMAIAEIQAKKGDIAGVHESLVLAKKIASSIKDKFKYHAYWAIAKLQAKKGDIAGAREYLVLAQKSVKDIESYIKKYDAYRDIAELQAETGDIAGARESIALAQKSANDSEDDDYGDNKFSVYMYIAKTKMQLVKVLPMPGDEVKSWTDLALIYQIKPSLADLQEFLESLKEDKRPYEIVKALTSDGLQDMVDALKTLQNNEVKWSELRAQSTQ